jgi:hypothetical protein
MMRFCLNYRISKAAVEQQEDYSVKGCTDASYSISREAAWALKKIHERRF